jgi:tetratricopeptide (TPR) repeat protein
MLTASIPTGIPTIDIKDKRGTEIGATNPGTENTDAAIADASEATLSLDQLSESLYKALTHYPYYTIVSGFSPIEQPKKLELLLRAIRAKISPQTGINRENFNSLSFTRVSVARPSADGEATQLSLTHSALPPHTDSAYDLLPHEMVVFHCIEADENGGKTFMIPLDDILQRLDDEVIVRLRDPVYPFGEGQYPIICGDRNAPFIRYYNVQLQQAAIAESTEFTREHRLALDTLDTLLAQDELYHKFHLQPGQILFMHNQRVLHGRTALTQGTHRILYRMRLGVASLSAHEQMVAASDVRSHMVLAKELEWLGRHERALHHYQQAAKLAPEQQDIQDAYSALLLKTGTHPCAPPEGIFIGDEKLGVAID